MRGVRRNNDSSHRKKKRLLKKYRGGCSERINWGVKVIDQERVDRKLRVSEGPVHPGPFLFSVFHPNKAPQIAVIIAMGDTYKFYLPETGEVIETMEVDADLTDENLNEIRQRLAVKTGIEANSIEYKKEKADSE